MTIVAPPDIALRENLGVHHSPFAADSPAPLQGQQAVPKQVPYQMAREPGLQVGSLGALENLIKYNFWVYIWFGFISSSSLDCMDKTLLQQTEGGGCIPPLSWSYREPSCSRYFWPSR